jgi:oxaloacetate decarboxylase alpha subunit/pyruvate carboxylase subunit B
MRLEKIKEAIGDVSKLTALSRGRNLFGYNPYPEDVIEGFNRNAIQSGIGIMRIFDALNDVENMKSSIKYVKANGGIADCTVCYTVDPKFPTKERVRALLHGKVLPYRIFTKEYFMNKAKELEELGADMISIKDMAGLIPPGKTGRLMKMLKEHISVPIDFHTHCTPGYGLASTLMAIINDVDIVDTAIGSFAGGPAAPAFELIQIFCDKLKIDTGVNKEAVGKINKELRKIRKDLAEYDSYKMFPIEFDISNYKLPKEIDMLFDLAIKEAREDKENDLLETTLEIEKYFNYPEPDLMVKKAEIPGGMYTNMLSQLKQLKLEDLLPRVLELVPVVRVAAGCPPLVTPTSQIVGVQAVNCVIDENKGVPFYTNKSTQFVNLVKGVYGRTPIPIDPEFRKAITGVKKETPYDTSKYRKQPNPKLDEFGGVRLAQNEKEALLLELFPSVANDFLRKKIEERFWAEIFRVEDEKNKKVRKEKEKYELLTPEEKKKLLEEGLYNNF